MRIIDAMARALKLPDHVAIARDIADRATPPPPRSPWPWSACSRAARPSSGDIALLIAFGAGLAYAAQVVTVP